MFSQRERNGGAVHAGKIGYVLHGGGGFSLHLVNGETFAIDAQADKRRLDIRCGEENLRPLMVEGRKAPEVNGETIVMFAACGDRRSG